MRGAFERTVQQVEAAASEEARDSSLSQIASLVSLDSYGTCPPIKRFHPDTPTDLEATQLVALIERQYGRSAAKLAELWLEESREGAVVGRDHGGALAWFAQFTDPRKVADRMSSLDPALAIVLPWLDGLKADDDAATMCRFFTPVEGRFVVDNAATASLMTEMQRRLLLSQASIPISVQPAWVLDELSTWGRHPAIRRFECESNEWVICGYDLRRRSPFEIIRRRMGSSCLPTPSRGDFDQAVRLVLRNYSRGDRLARNPLADWLALSGPSSMRQQELRSHVQAAIARFGSQGDDARHAHLLTATFLHGDTKQRAVAAELGMGFSTYRNHLRIATERLSLILWEQMFELPPAAIAPDPSERLPRSRGES